MSSFDPVAASLRQAIMDGWKRDAIDGDTAAQQVTLDTNSTLVEARTEALFAPFIDTGSATALRGYDVIDLGCGYGAMSLYLAGLGAAVTGVDPHAERLHVSRLVASEHGLNARFAQGRMEELTIEDGRYDLAVINNALCYLVDGETRARALTEARRVLRPGGRVLIRDPNRMNPRDQFTGLPLVHLFGRGAAARMSGWLGRARSDVLLHGAAGLRRELRRAGFVSDAQLPVRPDRRARALRAVTGYVHVTAVSPDGDRPLTPRRNGP